MTTEIILMNLRSRLAIVSRQIDHYEAAMSIVHQQQALVNDGRLDALIIERDFLNDLIGRIEREGVTP